MLPLTAWGIISSYVPACIHAITMLLYNIYKQPDKCPVLIHTGSLYKIESMNAPMEMY